MKKLIFFNNKLLQGNNRLLYQEQSNDIITGPISFYLIAYVKQNNTYGNTFGGRIEYDMWDDEDFVNIWGERDAVIGEHTLYPTKDSLRLTAYDQYYIIKCYADENMTLKDWVNSRYNTDINIDEVTYNGITYSNAEVEKYRQRAIFTTPVIRNKWTNNIQYDPDGDIISDDISTFEQFRQLYPIFTEPDEYNQIFHNDFYEAYETVSLNIAAKITSWDGDLEFLIKNYLPFRNQDERATYITCEWNVLGYPQGGEVVNYNEVISDGTMFLCNVLPVYDGGDGV